MIKSLKYPCIPNTTPSIIINIMASRAWEEARAKLPEMPAHLQACIEQSFFFYWNLHRKIGMRPFFGKNRNERQPDNNLSGIENKDKSKARLSLGLSQIVDMKKHVIWQSLLNPLCPHFKRTETAGWTRGPAEGKKRDKARDSVGFWSWKQQEDRAEWVL